MNEALHHRVRAYNTATASTNRIHDDTVAQSLGFRGGLVPGVDVFAYLCHLPAARWGGRWLEGGAIQARFQQPVYDGDEVTVAGSVLDGALGLALTDPSGVTCATGRATLVAGVPVPDPAGWPSGHPPDDPPPATAESLLARPFGQLDATFRADRAGEYLDDVREDLALFRDGGVAHPGWLLRFANRVLTANVTLGPWIHVESDVQLLTAVRDGDRIETRALVTDVFERGGHELVTLDVLQVVGERPVTRTRHTAIHRPRGTW